MTKKIDHWPQIALIPEDLDSPIDFGKVFGRKAPVHIEIGTGKAAFLLPQAREHPEIDFLGIEWANKYYKYAADRLGRWQIKNAKMIRTDAAQFIREFLPDESVDCFHIYFPDPWPKKRHHKRRFFCRENLDQLLRCLKPAGIIQITTDHEDYFKAITEVIAANKTRIEEIDFIRPPAAAEDELVGTNFERKYIKEGRKVHFVAMRKT